MAQGSKSKSHYWKNVDLVISDAPSLEESVVEGNAAARDRALAHHLVGIAILTAPPEQTTVGDALDESLMARLAALYLFGKSVEGDVWDNTMGGTGEAAAGPSVSAASRQREAFNWGLLSMHCVRPDEASRGFFPNTLWAPLLPGELTDYF